MSNVSVYKKKLLELNDYLDNINFSLGNKREYIIGNYHDLVLNNNLHLNIIFEANVYNFSPNKKVFLQIKELEYNNYLKLINKVKNDLGLNVILDNSLFSGNNNNSNNYILADINKSKNNIFTKFYNLDQNNFKSINVNLVPNNFRAIITIRIKSLLEKDDNFMLNNELFQIIVKKEIILDKNDKPDDLEIIMDFI
jgi:hypothetical protein